MLGCDVNGWQGNLAVSAARLPAIDNDLLII